MMFDTHTKKKLLIICSKIVTFSIPNPQKNQKKLYYLVYTARSNSSKKKYKFFKDFIFNTFFNDLSESSLDIFLSDLIYTKSIILGFMWICRNTKIFPMKNKKLKKLEGIINDESDGVKKIIQQVEPCSK